MANIIAATGASTCGAPLGAREYHCLWRRSKPGDHRRGVGWFRFGQCSDGFSAVERADCERDWIQWSAWHSATDLVYAWTEEDEQVSEMMRGSYANFIKDREWRWTATAAAGG